MSDIRLYVDEDASEQGVIDGLARLGVDVLTAKDADNLQASDEVQLDFAAERGRVLYSLNACDFARLHADYLRQGYRHAGILLIPRQRYGVREKIRRLRALLEITSAEEIMDQLFFL